MVKHKLWYATALGITGLGSLGLSAWVWLEGGASWYHRMAWHPGWMMVMPLVLLALLVAGVVFWSHRRPEHRIDALGDLAAEYVEGRIGREDFLARQAVLKESL